MGHIRRYNPLSWRLRTVNLVFASILASLVSLYFVTTVPSFASEPPVALFTAPSAGLFNSEVVSAPPDGKTLPTPETQIGLYEPHTNLTFLYAHSTTTFAHLPNLKLGDPLTYHDLTTKVTTTYTITDITTRPNSAVSMRELFLEPTDDTLILMTCAGNLDPARGTYDARLIIHATAN